MCVITDFISVKLLKNKIAPLYHALAPILLSWSPQQTSHLLFIRGLSPVRMQTHPVGHIFSISSIPWISCPLPCLPSNALCHSKIRVQLSTPLTCGLLTDAGIKTPQTEDTSHPRSPDSAGPSVLPVTVSATSDLLHDPSTTNPLALFHLTPQHWCFYVGLPWSPQAMVTNDSH